MKTDSQAFDDFSGIESEHALIGGLLLDNRAFDRVSDRLRPEHFCTTQNQKIFAEICAQLNAGKSCDVFTVYAAMGDAVRVEDLNAYAQYVPSAVNIKRYADIIIERHKSRALLTVSAEITELAHDHQQPIENRVERAQGLLVKLLDDAPRDDWVSAYEGMVGHTQVLEDRLSGKTTAWPTGLSDLDEYLEGGLRPGELVIVGARPSQGKTALGMTIGVNMAHQLPVGMLSMEMSKMEVYDRLTAMLGNVSMSSIKRPYKGTGLQWDRVIEGTEKAKVLKFQVSDQGGLNINQVRSKARNAKRLHGLSVLVVDYIGLMAGLDAKQTRNSQLEEISRGLKSLSKELDICVLCLAQLNRKTEERPESMPQMSDLRDSGALEQDADVILFIKRPIMSNPELGDDWKYYAKLSVAKNRQGRCGYLDLSYIGEQTRFSNWSGQAPSKAAPTRFKGGGL